MHKYKMYIYICEFPFRQQYNFAHTNIFINLEKDRNRRYKYNSNIQVIIEL